MATTTYSGYDAVWGYWISDAGGTASAVTYDMVWDTWNMETSWNSQTTCTTDVWNYWITDAQAQYRMRGFERKSLDGVLASQLESINAPTEERLKALAELEEEKRLKRIAEEKRKEAAEAVALELLETFIGRKEREVYEQTGRLMVKGKEADYIIDRDRGVSRVEKDKIVDLCIHLKEKYKYPDTDNVIAVAFNLRNDEADFNVMANRHGTQERPSVLPRCANGFD